MSYSDIPTHMYIHTHVHIMYTQYHLSPHKKSELRSKSNQYKLLKYRAKPALTQTWFLFRTLLLTYHSPREPGKGSVYAEQPMFKCLIDTQWSRIYFINFHYLKLNISKIFLGFVTDILTLQMKIIFVVLAFSSKFQILLSRPPKYWDQRAPKKT